MHTERFSALTLDAGGRDPSGRIGDRWPRAARAVLEDVGAVHVQDTGIRDLSDLLPLLPALGFGPEHQFRLGGRTSADVQQKWAAPGLRRMDWYPPDLYLLPNNEVQYRRCGPRRVLFACLTAPGSGGRIFLHSAKEVEHELQSLDPDLLKYILRFGLSIETGFLHRDHPLKPANYFQSWQERFQTDDPGEAAARARAEVDEYDACWWREEPDGPPTLMTRITFAGAWGGFLRFPRVALDPPCAQNGWRRFPLGDGRDLTPDEQEAIRTAFLRTRQGVPLRAGDLVLFDNLRYGHSRESFSGSREVYVGMAGELRDPPDLSRPAPVIVDCVPGLIPDRVPAPPGGSAPRSVPAPAALPRYHIPPGFDEPLPARTFDAAGAFADPERLDPAVLSAVLHSLDRYGAVHVQRTGLRLTGPGDLPLSLLHALGFGPDQAFPWGGLYSGRTSRAPLSRELRATDAYPPRLWLLPHNEILYQRDIPARILFFSAADAPPGTGGRTFVHSAARLYAWLRDAGSEGSALLEGLEAYGQIIEMGFLHEDHPSKPLNYLRSWQNRFQTSDYAEAEARCRDARHQFDGCWWRREPGGLDTLMTRFRVSLFHGAGEGRVMLFPRIELDDPAPHNGYRRYPRGDGRPFTDPELRLLISAFLATREGVRWRSGDLLLVDNLRYGHSREAYTGDRTIAVAMAGQVTLR